MRNSAGDYLGPVLKLSLASLLVVALAFSASADETVLFYDYSDGDSTAPTQENTYTVEDRLSQLSGTLEGDNFTVNRVSATVESDMLKEYEPDVIALADPRNIAPSQIGTFVRWTVRDGGSLWVCTEPENKDSSINTAGETSASIMTLANSFNLEISGSLLEDQETYIQTNDSEGTTVNTDALGTYQKFKSTRSGSGVLMNSYVKGLTMNVDTVGFYGASGIMTPDDPEKIWTAVRGEDSTYTPNAPVFLKGSYPSLVTGTKLGKGRAVFTSDCDVYANENIGEFDNKQLAINTFHWLTPNEEYQSMNYTDLILESEALTRQKTELESEIQSFEHQVSELQSTNQELQSQIAQSNREEQDEGPPIAAIIAGILFVLLTVFVVVFREQIRERLEDLNNNIRGEETEEDSEDVSSKAEQLGEDLDLG